ncbi:MAG: hypothetical protein AAFY71_25955 [Bacteroidota bacterium]
MRNAFILLGILFLWTPYSFAQTIKATDIKLGYSKEASKAAKRGELFNAGFAWNKDKTQLYKLSAFKDKKTDELLAEIQVYNQQGSLDKTEVVPATEENLGAYEIKTFDASNNTFKKALSGYKALYINNPTLAGKPKLVYGSFEEKYGSLGVFQRFKFKKDHEVELGEKFWAQVFFPLGDDLLERNNYLLQPPASKKLARIIYSMRNAYMPQKGKAFVAGLKAVSGADVFLSGIMDLSTGKWIEQHEIKLPYGINLGKLEYLRNKNGTTSILIPSKDGFFTLLTLDQTGKELNQTSLGLSKAGIKNGPIPSTFLLGNGSATLAFTTKTVGLSGGSMGLGVAKVENGKEIWVKDFTNDLLLAKVIMPAKEKIKINKLKMPVILGVRQIALGGYLVSLKARKSNGQEAFMIAQFDAEGDLQAVYPLPEVQPLKDEVLLETLPMRYIQTGDAYYMVVRKEIKGFEKGQYTEVTKTQTLETTYSYRVDETITRGYVVKINPSRNSCSNVLQLPELLVGDSPGILSADGTLFLQGTDRLILVK